MKMHLVFKCCFIFDLMIVNFLSNAISLMNHQVEKLPNRFPCHLNSMSHQARTYSHILTLASSTIEPSRQKTRHLVAILIVSPLSFCDQPKFKTSSWTKIFSFFRHLNISLQTKVWSKVSFPHQKNFLLQKNSNIFQLIRSSGCLILISIAFQSTKTIQSYKT